MERALPPRPPAPVVGTTLRLPEVDFSKVDQTLILVLCAPSGSEVRAVHHAHPDAVIPVR